MSEYDPLNLKNQLCFPLYAASREIIKRYRPFLEKLDLTYTQYIAMMVFWEEQRVSAKTLGERLLLDSGTLTPVLKSLEAKGLIRDKWLFFLQYYCSEYRKEIKPGTYVLRSTMTAEDMFAVMAGHEEGDE